MSIVWRLLVLCVLVVGASLAPSARVHANAIDVPPPSVPTARVVLDADDPAMASVDYEDSAWRLMPWEDVDPQRRLVWMRLHVTMSTAQIEAFRDRPLAISISAMAAYEVFWNGERVGASGVPGASAREEVPGPIDTRFLLPSRLSRVGDNVLAIRLSSFHLSQRLATPMHFVGIAPIDAAGLPFPRPWFAMACAGALLLGAAYFAILYASDRRDRGALWLALISICVLVQLSAEIMRALWHYPYPLHIPRLRVVLLAAIGTGMFLVVYVADRHARARLWRWVGVAAMVMLVAVMAFDGFDTKTGAALFFALWVMIAAAFGAVLRRDRDAIVTTIWAVAVIVWQMIEIYTFLDQQWYVAITILLLILFAQQVSVLRREQEQRVNAQLRATRLELELLKRQIQPHFLLNSLTALSEWVESDPATGVRMIEALADEFRALNAIGDRRLIPLSEELKLCRHHLTIMSLRLDRPFELRCEGVDEALCVPPAVLHTLIENALTHNAYPRGAVLQLTATRETDDRWRYTLRSPCTSTEASPTRGGSGQNYVRARLAEAFGDRASFSAARIDDEWIDTVILPEHRACAS